MMDIKDFEMFEMDLPEEKVAKLEAGKEVPYIASLGKRKVE